MANSEFYTYIHRRADTGEVFYVGKGKGKRYLSRNRRSAFWVNFVSKYGLLAEIVCRFERDAEALVHERKLIAEYRLSGARLVNLTDGGEGTSGFKHSPETVAKISRSNRGKRRSDECRQGMSAARTGVKTGPLSAEHRAAISRSNTGKRHSEETKAKLAAAQTGVKCTEAQRQAIIANLTGRPVSEKTRLKISEARIGIVFSDDHKANISRMKKGLVMSEASRLRISNGKKQFFLSDASIETRRKLSEAAKRQWAAKKAAESQK